MADTVEGQNERPVPDKEREEGRRRYRAARRKFDEAAAIADLNPPTRAWQAWVVYPERKEVAPIWRLCIGDDLGNVVYDRPLVITAVASLVQDLVYMIETDASDIGSLPGFKLSLPGPKVHMLDMLRDARDTISRVLDVFEKNDLISALDEEETTSDELSETRQEE